MVRKWGSSRGVFILFAAIGVLIFAVSSRISAQSNSGIIQGTVTDPSKAAIPGAKVPIENPVSHHVNDVQTDVNGRFEIPNSNGHWFRKFQTGCRPPFHRSHHS
jgi:Carboxypeptidase regulatory-like domain